MYIDIVTYWAATGSGAEGEVYALPIIFKGRWEDRNDLFLTPRGEEVTSESVVFCSEPVEVNGYLYFGVSAQADPRNQEGAKQIRAVINTPDLRRIRVERRAML